MADEALKAAMLERAKRERDRRRGGAQEAPPQITPEMAQAAIDSRNERDAALGTFLNKAGESMTMGLMGDEASAALESLIPGVDYETRRDHYRQQEKQFEKEHPVLSMGADIGGALVAPVGALGAVGKGAGIAKRALASAGATGGLSGLYGFMEGEGGAQNRAGEALKSGAWGAGIGAAIPVAGKLAQGIANRRAASRGIAQAAKNAPTTAQQKKIATDLYRQVDDLGVEVKPEAFDDARQGILDALRAKTSFDELPGAGSLTPKSARVMQMMGKASDELAGQPQGSRPAVPFSTIEQMRRRSGAAAGNFTDKADQQAGMTIIEGLDDFVNNLSADDVVRGDVKELPTIISKARSLWAQSAKSQTIDDAMEAAENYRYGFANGIKWQFKNILNNPKRARGFSEADKKVMQRVINGSVPEKFLELLGSGLTSIGGIAGAGLGAVSGGVPGFVAGLGLTGASMAARGGSNAMARKNADLARALIASGKTSRIPLEASPAVRQITEQLLRRGTAAGLQRQ